MLSKEDIIDILNDMNLPKGVLVFINSGSAV